MDIQNKLNNYIWGVTRVRQKGSKNVGKYFDWRHNGYVICKYDWSLPFVYVTRKIELGVSKTKHDD